MQQVFPVVLADKFIIIHFLDNAQIFSKLFFPHMCRVPSCVVVCTYSLFVFNNWGNLVFNWFLNVFEFCDSLCLKYHSSTNANITRCCFIHKQLQILRAFTGRVLTSDCSHRRSSPESTCVFALSLSSRPFTGGAAKEFTANDSGNRGSEQPRRYEHR